MATLLNFGYVSDEYVDFIFTAEYYNIVFDTSRLRQNLTQIQVQERKPFIKKLYSLFY